MDARSDRNAIPLAVDLDGTLIATDLLWEGLFVLLKKNPLYLFLVPFWLTGGPARLKQEIARRIDIDPASLPYRVELLERLRAEHGDGRKIVLATGTPRKFAEAIAAYLGIFDRVLATDGPHNLTSGRKRASLVAAYGDAGFDYAGNSGHDLKVFDAARNAIVVAPDRSAQRWQAAHGAETMPAPKPTLKTYVKMLRVHQWLKNSLIAVPMVLSHEYFNVNMIWQCVLAFVSFSAVASAIYIVNDFFDLALDRKHPTKRNRPFASGALSIPFGFGAILVLLAIGIATGCLLPIEFLGVLCGYMVVTTAYSLSFKRMLLIDVLTLAGLYTIRVLAGAAATGVDVSFWLLAFSIFFFLSLALVKRFVELRTTTIPAGERIAGRGYRTEDQEIVAQAGMASAFSSALVLALYMDSVAVRELYPHPWVMWPLAPIVLYLTMRVWILARRDEMHDDPVVFIIRDWRSQIVVAIGSALLVAGGWGW
ncbi:MULTISPECIES: UbiA family prenyltransferase [Mesorhizobium]|uniref:4-hydroxybenzoate polyprenyltransferase n=1 Tax=Mesorhizobium shonense TaxID=1209948 RepID=A0ABV2HVZ2_9HYPH|nr:UbiA family prenyltransferase [Mesorhizobium sp.]RWB21754.1 MAG: UbiA family prenyltransferase [Mesorhizobium sp.]RWE00715.1 MAG: UbiA family prenyltransferase [Mesorhizobium sp.]TIS51956.1 MAG: UbiA family prenyltransferase [Mesorhizobium sp.]